MPRLPVVSAALLAATAAAASAAPATSSIAAVRGKRIFEQNCALCHSTGVPGQAGTPGGQGPSLAGVVGRKAASRSDFGYSKALRQSGLTWDEATLDRFLAAPGELVPGTTMAVSIPRDADRRELIRYLGTLSPVSAASNSTTVPASLKLTGPIEAGDWRADHPGVHHTIVVGDLPRDFASPSSRNSPIVIDRPAGAHLSVPPGFEVKLFADNLLAPRLLRVAPNGDIFVAETAAGRVRVLRAADGAEHPSQNEVFASGLRGPFGIAFYPAEDPQWVYVASINSVARYPYRSGDLHARGPAETIVPQLAHSTGGHSTRDIVFSPDGSKLFISVGSGSNVAEMLDRKSPEEIRAWQAAHGLGTAWGYETNRANVLVTDPQGRAPLRVYASGIRNPVGLAINPTTGRIWVSTNERDGLGDNLVPDYISSIRQGRYYGWPWYYMGNHEDPRHPGERPDLAGKVTTPDVPVQAHSASLQLTFYTATSGAAHFPARYKGDVFACFHGSWNRRVRTGSKVVHVHLVNGEAVGGYDDFLTGWVVDNGHVWGRPVGVAVAHDGALLVSEDGNSTIWRISYLGGR